MNNLTTDTYRDPRLVAMATQTGVSKPSDNKAQSRRNALMPIPFIENKIYDFERISDLLALSVSQNHHANGGPVSRLLESMVAHLAKQPEQRKVIAVSSGTSALHMACGFHAINSKSNSFRWVTSAFNFFSAQVGPLSDSIVIDCASNGGFDLETLKALPLDSYDGVVYTNVFAQYSNWCEVSAYCVQNGKSFVIDNATGLFDRPTSAMKVGSPIEIISAHHTKPWGVGEGGFIICDAKDEETLRQLSNFSASLPRGTEFAASNFKLSDLSAAAIIDRLERTPSWAPCYIQQQVRLHNLMVKVNEIMPFLGSTTPCSPRAHSPFLSTVAIEPSHVSGPVTFRKYYKPLATDAPIPNAKSLFARVFSLSNAGEMMAASDDEILTQVQKMLELAMVNKFKY
jgi:dTDP-4-amino-4,6-dideoxygalactose transaminase